MFFVTGSFFLYTVILTYHITLFDHIKLTEMITVRLLCTANEYYKVTTLSKCHHKFSYQCGKIFPVFSFFRSPPYLFVMLWQNYTKLQIFCFHIVEIFCFHTLTFKFKKSQQTVSAEWNGGGRRGMRKRNWGGGIEGKAKSLLGIW